MANYGLPYMGSKNKIAEWVVGHLPTATNFYDLFCGGCAITHCAIEHNRYKNYFINDINGMMPKMFIDSLKGKYKSENRWIGKDEYNSLRDNDAYARTCFSFGNKGKTYAYSENTEQLKKAMHYALMNNDLSYLENMGIDARKILSIKDFDMKYKVLKEIVRESIKKEIRLQSAEALKRINSIAVNGKMPNIKAYNKSYDQVPIKPDSVIYCDIPYRNTEKYSKGQFDYDKFYHWALSQSNPVYISEYWMPNEFVAIASKGKTMTMSAKDNSAKAVEKIFVPRKMLNR